MTNMQRPVIVDPQLPNLADTHIDLHCVPDKGFDRQEASSLCRKVRTLFENQGARVVTHISDGRTDTFVEPAEGGDDPAPRTELIVELRVRRVHRSMHQVSWLLSGATFTLVPAVTEQTFAQDITIRDGSGFLLLTDTVEGRIVTRYGVGSWAGNGIANLARGKEEKLTRASMQQELSTDLYRQLSQLVFNARLHAQVLQAGAPVVR